MDKRWWMLLPLILILSFASSHEKIRYDTYTYYSLGQRLVRGIFDPGFPLILRLFGIWGGMGAVMASAVLYVLSVRRLLGERTALLLTLTPLFFLYSTTLYSDMLGASLIITALAFPRPSWLSGLIMGFAGQVRPEAWGVFLVELWRRRDLGFLASFVLMSAYYMLLIPGPFLYHRVLHNLLVASAPWDNPEDRFRVAMNVFGREPLYYPRPLHYLATHVHVYLGNVLLKNLPRWLLVMFLQTGGLFLVSWDRKHLPYQLMAFYPVFFFPSERLLLPFLPFLLTGHARVPKKVLYASVLLLLIQAPFRPGFQPPLFSWLEEKPCLSPSILEDFPHFRFYDINFHPACPYRLTLGDCNRVLDSYGSWKICG